MRRMSPAYFARGMTSGDLGSGAGKVSIKKCSINLKAVQAKLNLILKQASILANL